MFREFESKQKELHRWVMHTKSRRIKGYLNQTETIEYMFALGIYYRYVIAPLTRTSAFFERLETGSNAGLLVGGREIGPQYRDSIRNAESHFNNVLSKYGLGERFFAITDIKQIVMALIEIDERKYNGQD